MIISTSQKLRHQSTSTLNVKIGANCIENVNVYKILGIFIDSKLTWSDQIKNIARKVNTGISLLRRIMKLIPVSYRVIFTHSFIFPHFDYCSNVWGGGAKHLHINRLLNIQKRYARTIFNVGPRISHVSLFISLKWMDIFNRISYRRAITVYKCLNCLLPSYLNDMFTNVSELSTRSTRSSSNNDFYLSKVKLALFKQSFAYNTAHRYNALPKCIKQASSLY